MKRPFMSFVVAGVAGAVLAGPYSNSPVSPTASPAHAPHQDAVLAGPYGKSHTPAAVQPLVVN